MKRSYTDRQLEHCLILLLCIYGSHAALASDRKGSYGESGEDCKKGALGEALQGAGHAMKANRLERRAKINDAAGNKGASEGLRKDAKKEGKESQKDFGQAGKDVAAAHGNQKGEEDCSE